MYAVLALYIGITVQKLILNLIYPTSFPLQSGYILAHHRSRWCCRCTRRYSKVIIVITVILFIMMVSIYVYLHSLPVPFTMLHHCVYMYYINHAQYVRMGDKAQGRVLYLPYVPVFGHGLCNLCHHRIQLFLPVL